MNRLKQFRPSIFWTLAAVAGVALMGAASPILAEEVPPPPAPAPAAEQPAQDDAAKPAEGAKSAKPGAPEGDLFQGDLQREMSAAEAIAENQRKRQARASVRSLSRIQNMLTYEFDVVGKTEEAALKDASVRALIDAASRLYFDDYVLIGRDVLDPYLRNYGDQFIARRTPVSKKILADGTVSMRVRLGVDVNRFYDDLKAKRFLGKPEVRPIMAVVLEEVVDGQASQDGRGRRILEEALRAREMRVETRRMLPHPVTMDVSVGGEVERRAREEAQRGGVEVIVTGRLNVHKSRDNTEILYDNFYFYQAEVELTMIRADNGEVLGTTRQSFAASAMDDPATPDNEGPAAAMEKTFQELMPRSVAVLTEGFLPTWQRTMLDIGDYRLLVTNASDEQLEGVFNILHTFNPKIQTYTKARFGDTAVINVFLPEVKPGQIEDFLRKSRTLQFQLRSADERRIELQVL